MWFGHWNAKWILRCFFLHTFWPAPMTSARSAVAHHLQTQKLFLEETLSQSDIDIESKPWQPFIDCICPERTVPLDNVSIPRTQTWQIIISCIQEKPMLELSHSFSWNRSVHEQNLTCNLHLRRCPSTFIVSSVSGSHFPAVTASWLPD